MPGKVTGGVTYAPSGSKAIIGLCSISVYVVCMCCMVFVYLAMCGVMLGTCVSDVITKDLSCYGIPWRTWKAAVLTIQSVEASQCKALMLYNFNDSIICRQL